jgi:hypothetical protein
MPSVRLHLEQGEFKMSTSNDPVPGTISKPVGRANGAEVLTAIRNGLAEGPQTVNLIAATLRDCAAGLRLCPSAHALERLGEAVGNLALLAELVSGLRSGLALLNLDSAPLTGWDSCAATFTGVVDALERRDWVLLSDLIEYELCPTLDETERGMSALHERLAGIAP